MTDVEELLGRYQQEIGRLVGHLRLADVRMVSSSVSLGDDLGLSPTEIDHLQAQFGFTVEPEDSKVFYFLGFSGDLLAADRETVATFEIRYGCLYEGLPDPDDTNALSSFGVLVASMTLWAYIRAQLSNQFALMGLGTGFQLPLITAAHLIASGIQPPLDEDVTPAP